ncbi:MAG: hypothetical protein QOE61_5442 [Micromonosporaceae bacterium]|nr:hypothetical protein [Micromonosporaceae bacterium]
MPTYQYACTACGHQLEAVQSFTDDALTECPACAGRLRKLFSAVGIVFKGSGFYRTDSRPENKADIPAVASTSTNGSKDGKTSSSDSSTSSTPATSSGSTGSSPSSKGSSSSGSSSSGSSSSGSSSSGSSSSGSSGGATKAASAA